MRSSTIRAEFRREDYRGYEHRVAHWREDVPAALVHEIERIYRDDMKL